MYMLSTLHLLKRNYVACQKTAQKGLEYLKDDDYFLRIALSQNIAETSPDTDWLALRNLFKQNIHELSAHPSDESLRIFAANNYAFLAHAETYLGNLTDALKHAALAEAIPERMANPQRTTYLNIYSARMVAAYYHGSLAEAEHYEERFRSVINISFAPQFVSFADAFLACVQFLTGRPEEAITSVRKSVSLSPYGLVRMPLPLPLLRMLIDDSSVDIASFIEANRGDFTNTFGIRRLECEYLFCAGSANALSVCKQLSAEINQDWRTDNICLQIVLASLAEQNGNKNLAQQHLSTSLLIAEPEMIIQPFLANMPFIRQIMQRLLGGSDCGTAMFSGSNANDFVQHLMRAMKASDGLSLTSGRQRTAELTSREKEINYLLLAAQSVADIAERLCLSKETVRRHIANIYKKCDVHSHAQLMAKYGR
jgi:DNA-binding CsgD family transcriptional regulator